MKNNFLKLFNSLVFKITVSFSVVLVGTLLSLGVYLQHVAKIESENIQNEYNQLKAERIQRLLDSITKGQTMNLRDVQRKLIDYSKISGANIKLYDENNMEVFDTSKGLSIKDSRRNPIFKVIPTSLGGMVVEVNQPQLVSIQAINKLGQVITIPAKDIDFKYRDSRLSDNLIFIILYYKTHFVFLVFLFLLGDKNKNPPLVEEMYVLCNQLKLRVLVFPILYSACFSISYLDNLES